MMNLNLKDSHLNRNGSLLEKILKSNKAILETLTKNISGLGLDFKKQIINSQTLFDKMNLLFDFYTKKEYVDLTTFKNKLPADHEVKITPVIETILVNLSDHLVSKLIQILNLRFKFLKKLNSIYLEPKFQCCL